MEEEEDQISKNKEKHRIEVDELIYTTILKYNTNLLYNTNRFTNQTIDNIRQNYHTSQRNY